MDSSVDFLQHDIPAESLIYLQKIKVKSTTLPLRKVKTDQPKHDKTQQKTKKEIQKQDKKVDCDVREWCPK